MASSFPSLVVFRFSYKFLVSLLLLVLLYYFWICLVHWFHSLVASINKTRLELHPHIFCTSMHLEARWTNCASLSFWGLLYYWIMEWLGRTQLWIILVTSAFSSQVVANLPWSFVAAGGRRNTGVLKPSPLIWWEMLVLEGLHIFSYFFSSR